MNEEQVMQIMGAIAQAIGPENLLAYNEIIHSLPDDQFQMLQQQLAESMQSQQPQQEQAPASAQAQGDIGTAALFGGQQAY